MTKRQSLTFAIPKGRLYKDTSVLFKKAGIEIPEDTEDALWSTKGNITFLKIRAQDVPIFVKTGVADIGVVGVDVLEESRSDLIRLLNLGIGFCRVVLASMPGQFESYNEIKTIATKYPELTRNFCLKHGFQVEIIKLYGSVELAAATGMARAIVDLVSTGRTLAAHGLKERETLMESNAVLVANALRWKQKQNEIALILEKVEKVL